jgi:hypothetical protein
MQTILDYYSYLDPHHMDADLDSTYHSDADPDAIRMWIRILIFL